MGTLPSLHPLKSALRWAIKYCLPVIVILVTVSACFSLLEGKAPRKAKKKTPPARLVNIQLAEMTNETPTIVAQGEVTAKRRVEIRSQLRGVIQHLSPDIIPGGYVHKGQSLVTLEPQDYLLSVREAEAILARHQALYDIELGRRRAAEMEYKLSGETLAEQDLELVLRQPQLDQIEADIARSQASLDKALLNVARTQIKAPFDAQILRFNAAEGSLLRDNTSLMDLVATDTFWLTVNIPSSHLKWLTIPSSRHHMPSSKTGCAGSSVTIRNPAEWGQEAFREGCVASLLPELNSKVKTASVLIRIDDPLATRPENKGKPEVLLNAFLLAEIQTNPFSNVVKLPRKFLQEDEYIWVMDSNDQLMAKTVSVAFRGHEDVLIYQGLQAGDKIITTPLIGAIEGIRLIARQPTESLITETPQAHAATPIPTQEGES